MTKSKQYSGYDIDVEISGIEKVGGKGARLRLHLPTRALALALRRVAIWATDEWRVAHLAARGRVLRQKAAPRRGDGSRGAVEPGVGATAQPRAPRE